MARVRNARSSPSRTLFEDERTHSERWLRPDVYKNQEYSVANAKKPITDYKKASGLPEGVAELTLYYCEQAIGFSNEVGLDLPKRMLRSS